VLVVAPAQIAPVVAAPPDCSPVEHDGNRYTICIIDLTESDLRLFWRDQAGAPYQTFRAVETALAGQGLRLGFAMNAGMFNDRYGPVGPLYRGRHRAYRRQHQ
jgi:uncharacterized protein YigE (DUF2233 family)